MKRRAALFTNSPHNAEVVYGQGRREWLGELVDLHPTIIHDDNFAQQAPELQDLEVIFSTWGMPRLEGARLAALPRLQAVFYAAGSVKNFAPPLLARGITVVSAWAANGVPVAEMTLALILLAGKGYFQNTRACTSHAGWQQAPQGPGNFGGTVALLGCGMIAQLLIERLRGFALRVIVYDPYLADATAADLGVEKVSLEEAFRRALVVSCHVPNLPSTQGMLRHEHFASMRPGATFINTGRGAQVVEADLIAVLRARPDLTAHLDVTHPEPPQDDSPLYALPNVHLSSHIAGTIRDERVRLADCVLEEFQAWAEGKPLRYAVSAEMLERMA